MIRIISIITCLLTFIFSSAQDSVWGKMHIDENLSVAMPGEVMKIDTFIMKDGFKMNMRFFKAETAFSTLGLTITPRKINLNVDNFESLARALDEIAEGVCKSGRNNGASCKVSDTVIDKIQGKKIMLHIQDAEDYSMSNYAFLLNDKLYMFTTNYVTDTSTLKNATREATKFLASIHFNKTSIQEQKFESKAESIGYKIGRFIGMLIIPALLILAVVYFVRKNNKNRF